MANLGREALRQYWDERRAHTQAQTKAGRVVIRSEGHRLQVAAPFSKGFNIAAKDLGGRWRYRTKVWSFPWSNRRSVLQLVRDTFGAEAMGSWGDYHG